MMGSISAMALADNVMQFKTEAAKTTEQTTLLAYPSFRYPRYLEDWSSFNPEDGNGWLDSIKHVEFNEDGSVWGSFGGSIRLRGENWQNYAWSDAPTAEDTFALFRVLAHADIHFSENFRMFFQAKSALATDRDLPGGKRPIDVDTLALQQAFFDVIIIVLRMMAWASR